MAKADQLARKTKRKKRSIGATGPAGSPQGYHSIQAGDGCRCGGCSNGLDKVGTKA